MTEKILQTAAARLVEEFSARGITVGTAESCTGGLIAKLITDVAGMKEKIVREIPGPPYNMGKPFLLTRERL